MFGPLYSEESRYWTSKPDVLSVPSWPCVSVGELPRSSCLAKGTEALKWSLVIICPPLLSVGDADANDRSSSAAELFCARNFAPLNLS